MGKDLIVRFDYSVLDKDDKGKLLYLAAEIKKSSTQHKKAGIAIGESVSKAHSILATAGKEGQFSAWVESECGFSRATAYNYMNAWETFGDCEVIDQFDNGALYVLAGANVPDEAVKEAVKIAKKGQHFTTEKAKEHIGKFRDLVKKTAPNKQVKGSIVQPLDNSNDSQASVTGGNVTHSAAPPKSLPTEGTVNQAEPGEQGAGDAGECPTGNCRGGGDHDFLDGACIKCYEPDDDGGEVEAPKADPVKEMFAALKEHIRQTVLLLDKINNATGRRFSQVNQTCQDTIDIVSVEVHKWAKACK